MILLGHIVSVVESLEAALHHEVLKSFRRQENGFDICKRDRICCRRGSVRDQSMHSSSVSHSLLMMPLTVEDEISQGIELTDRFSQYRLEEGEAL